MKQMFAQKVCRPQRPCLLFSLISLIKAPLQTDVLLTPSWKELVAPFYNGRAKWSETRPSKWSKFWQPIKMWRRVSPVSSHVWACAHTLHTQNHEWKGKYTYTESWMEKHIGTHISCLTIPSSWPINNRSCLQLSLRLTEAPDGQWGWSHLAWALLLFRFPTVQS